MAPIPELSNDNLVTLATALYVDADTLNAVRSEILRRLTPGVIARNLNEIKSAPVDSLFNMPAIEGEIKKLHYMVKDLHDRCDQTIIKLKEAQDDKNGRWSDADMEQICIEQMMRPMMHSKSVLEFFKEKRNARH